MNDRALLSVADMSAWHGTFRALHDVSFRLDEGEIVAVLGPNGAGKSTLFHAIAGLLRHSGSVIVDGHECHHRRDRMPIAYIPQRSGVSTEFPITVAQLVATGRRRFGRTAVDTAGTEGLLAEVGLHDKADQPISRLSVGQLQRAFVARSLAQEARLFLLDESLAGVDRAGAEDLLGVLTRLTERGAGVMIATHDLSLARRRFSRCLAVNRTVVADGRPGEVLVPENLEHLFGQVAIPA